MQHDPLSRCDCQPPYDPSNAIAARSDLADPNGLSHSLLLLCSCFPLPAHSPCPDRPAITGNYSNPYLGFGDEAGIDDKVTSYAMFKQGLSSVAISSPSYDQLPPFQFSTSPFSPPLYAPGLPDYWKFPWIQMQWQP